MKRKNHWAHLACGVPQEVTYVRNYFTEGQALSSISGRQELNQLSHHFYNQSYTDTFTISVHWSDQKQIDKEKHFFRKVPLSKWCSRPSCLLSLSLKCDRNLTIIISLLVYFHLAVGSSMVWPIYFYISSTVTKMFISTEMWGGVRLTCSVWRWDKGTLLLWSCCSCVWNLPASCPRRTATHTHVHITACCFLRVHLGFIKSFLLKSLI